MKRPKQSIAEFKKLFALTPKDHRKLPHAYYTVALAYLSQDEKLSREFYEKGLKSESDQLPFFLPYDSNFKDHLYLNFLNKC